MFVVDEANADAIRHAWHEGGELAGVVELRRYFPLINDPARAWSCVQAIVGGCHALVRNRTRIETGQGRSGSQRRARSANDV